VYAAHPMAMDMKTGMASISTPEVGLMSAACVALGRHYGLPTSSNGLCTDTCAPDAMATLEKWASGYLPAVAGANVNAGAGSLACVGSVSLEQLVIDDDLYGHVFRQARGMDLSDEALAEEVIAAVGPGRDFLLEDHTLAHFRREHYSSPLASRLNAPTWEAAGARGVLERAAQRVLGILAQPAESPLDERQSRDVDRLQRQAEAALRDLQVQI
jgi:trimethylamine---corrinoid protein Co-methyltransferase